MKQLVVLFLLISSLLTTNFAWAGHKLFVGNLPFATTSAEVDRLVFSFGEVLSVTVKSIDDNGESTANAVVKFSTQEGADSAADALDGTFYMGMLLRAKSKKPKEIIVVGSKVKDVVRSAGLRSDGELVQAVSDKVHELLEAAIKRAGKNKRGTVRPYDL
jgi:RNA recognition motif-containing protein